MKRNILFMTALVLFTMMPFENIFGQDCESCQAGVTESYKTSYGNPYEINTGSGNVTLANTTVVYVADQDIIIQNGAQLEVNKSKLMFKQGFGIVVQSGGTLIIRNGAEVTGIRECHSGWDGIEVQSGGTITVEANPLRSLIGNMVEGIHLSDGSTANISGTDFINNIIGVHTVDKTADFTLTDCYFDTYHAPSIDWVWPFECPGYTIPIVFAEVENSTDFTIGPDNEMRTATYGVRISDNSDKISVSQNRIFNVRHKISVESSSNITVSDNDLASLRPISNFPYNALNTDDEDAILLIQVDGFDVTCNRITHYNQLAYATSPPSLPEVTFMGVWTTGASGLCFIEDNELDNANIMLRFTGNNADVEVKNNIISNYNDYGIFIDNMSSLNSHGDCNDIVSHVNLFDQSGTADVQCDNPNFTFTYNAPPLSPFTPIVGGTVALNDNCALNGTPALSCTPGVERLSQLSGEPVAVDNINLFPNPAIDKVTLDLSGFAYQDFSVSIYNNFGALVKSIQVTDPMSQIDISELSPAFYQINVSANGKLLGSGKMVVVK